ncbi:MAG: MFS transporter [Parabacteroides sp.]|nr:MFS transporter [Parabacteroides sp.]
MEQIKRSLLTLISVTLVIRAAGNIFQPALSYLADDLGISQVEATTNFTLYYFCLMLSFLFFGPICDRFPKNRLLQVSLLGCLLGCIICGTATEIMFFDIGRCIQAFSAGLTLLSSQIWIGNLPDKKAMMSRLAWFSIIVSIAPILSPMVGGFISDCLSWRYDFGLIFVLCLVGLTITVLHPLPDVAKATKESAKHSPSEILRSYGTTLHRLPILALSFCVHILYMGQSVFTTISSFLFIDEFGTSASQLGIVSGGLLVAMVLGRFPVLYLSKHFSVRTVFLLCEALVLASCLFAIGYYFIEGTHTLTEVILIMGMQAVGFSGLAILSVNNIMLVSGEQKGAASGLNNFLNQAWSWLGVLSAQCFYQLGMSSVTIIQYMVLIIMVGSVMAVLFFLRAYPKYKNELEI